MQSDPDDTSGISESSMLQQPISDLPMNTDSKDLASDTRSYSLIRVKAVVCTVSMLFSICIFPFSPMLSQYLITRLSLEQNLNGSTTTITNNQCYIDHNDSKVTQADQIEAQVSSMMMILSYCTSVPGLMSGLIIGAYADYIGRRFTLLAPLLGLTIKFIMVALIIKFDLRLWLFYVTYAVEGLTGTGFVVILALFTITADLNTRKADRIFWITIVMAFGNISAACSSIVCGIMIREFGYFPTAAFLMSAMVGSFLVPLLFLPETQPHQEVRVLNLYKNVKRVFGFFLFDGSTRLKLTFCISVLMFFIAVMNELGASTIDTLYQLNRPFCWSSKMIGYYSALKTGGANLLALFLLGALQRCVRTEYIGLLAAVFQGMSYCLEAFVKTDWQFFLVPIVGVPSCLITPVIRGIMSLLAGPGKQGALFTSICVFEVACYMAASTIYNKLYAVTVSRFPGAVYLCMASFSGVTFVLMILYLRVHQERGKPAYEKVITTVESDSYDHLVVSRNADQV